MVPQKTIVEVEVVAGHPLVVPILNSHHLIGRVQVGSRTNQEILVTIAR